MRFDSVTLDPETDLELVRQMRAGAPAIWRCLTEPQLIEQWFAPKPVVTRDVAIDLWPGGSFRSVMDVPDHGEMAGHGCVLAVEPERLLVWTDLLQGGYRPARDSFGFTAIIRLEAVAGGTLYRAQALHRDADQRRAHEEMGFHDGWGKAAEQLEALALTL